ncbi:hypothetical protein RvY_11635 [Ramazzottius varieornatus]|uniref:Uncharacterized protein n=1 Tax=Ramazzottius varieornatus TaxID=947166 RepID=A0A1D1VGU1_RAMVA|nr:hypothetical protein RvY_11635 [Ramazzottius varieornatus]
MRRWTQRARHISALLPYLPTLISVCRNIGTTQSHSGIKLKMAEKEDHPVSELGECIDQVMPLALQTILDNSEAPIFKNILHVIATYGHEWFLNLTATGKFVQLSTGWTYVRRTNTVISEHSDMDEAVLDAIRHLSSAGKRAKLAEICNYIIAAFRLPEVLSPEVITEKIQCSANLMKVWGRVVVDKGCYRLSEEPLSGNEAKKAAVTTSLTSLSSKVDVKHEPEVQPQMTITIFPESTGKKLPVRTETRIPEKTGIDNDSKPDQRPDESHVSSKSFENAVEKINAVLHADQVSIISSTESHQSPVSPLSTPRGPDSSAAKGSMQVFKPSFGEPFLYAGGCYRLFVVYKSRIRTKVKLSVKDQVRVTFEQNKLRFCQIIIPPRKSHMAFVEVEKIEDGLEAIQKLHQRYSTRGWPNYWPDYWPGPNFWPDGLAAV